MLLKAIIRNKYRKIKKLCQGLTAFFFNSFFNLNNLLIHHCWHRHREADPVQEAIMELLDGTEI